MARPFACLPACPACWPACLPLASLPLASCPPGLPLGWLRACCLSACLPAGLLACLLACRRAWPAGLLACWPPCRPWPAIELRKVTADASFPGGFSLTGWFRKPSCGYLALAGLGRTRKLPRRLMTAERDRAGPQPVGPAPPDGKGQTRAAASRAWSSRYRDESKSRASASRACSTPAHPEWDLLPGPWWAPGPSLYFL